MFIYWFSSSFRMGDALPRPGRSSMGLHPAGRSVVPKERFLQGSSPKRTFSWCWSVCLSHLIKTTKKADKLEKHSLFRQKQTFCIIIKVFCWQNCCGRTRIINLFWVEVGIDPLWSGSMPLIASLSRAVTQIPRNQSDQLPPKSRCWFIRSCEL